MNKEKITLLIDQDDVLAEYIKEVTRVYNEKYDTNITMEMCNNWNLHEVFGERIETVMHDPEIFRNLEPTKDAIEVFTRMYFSGLFEMYIVTAAQAGSVEAKHEWINNYLPFFPEEHIIICRKKSMIKGDYLLDDGMHNIEAFGSSGGTPIIYNRAHNLEFDTEYKRVSGWIEFERLILEQNYPEKLEEYYVTAKKEAI